MLAPNSQWLRKCQVVIGKGGKGILVDALKISFEITKTIQHTPNAALIKIFNLNPDNENLIHNEYTDIVVNAGYANNVKVLFSGNIKHVFKYKDKTNWVVEIDAADGDNDYRNAVMNETLAAGTTRSNIVDRAVASFSAGTAKGFVGIDEYTNLRGVCLSGNTRNVLHNLARDAGANWSVQDGQLTIVKTSGTLPNQAIVVNSDTGMIDAPEINDKGIAVKTLLNPAFAVNGVIKLNNNDIRIREVRSFILSSRATKTAFKTKPPARLDPDGLYKIIKIRHRGNNREKDWVSELACISLNSPIPELSEDSSNNGEGSGE